MGQRRRWDVETAQERSSPARVGLGWSKSQQHFFPRFFAQSIWQDVKLSQISDSFPWTSFLSDPSAIVSRRGMFLLAALYASWIFLPAINSAAPWFQVLFPAAHTERHSLAAWRSSFGSVSCLANVETPSQLPSLWKIEPSPALFQLLRTAQPARRLRR